MFDAKIVRGTLIDGTGRAGLRLDVGILGDTIEAVADLSEAPAKTVIDAEGCLVTPGFVDIHSHSDMAISVWPEGASKLRQGVTTEITGNCGHSAAPTAAISVDASFESAENQKTGTNIAMLAGHGNLRTIELGEADIKASAQNLENMRRHLAKCLDEGAAGLSSGLYYPPGIFAGVDEVAAIATALGNQRLYSTHLRSESGRVFEAMDEAFGVSERTGCRLEISHLKACGNEVWGRMGEIIRKIERKREQGVDVAFDAYPYNAASTGLKQLFPPWTHDGGNAALLKRLKDNATRLRITEQVLHGKLDWDNEFRTVGPDNILVSASRSGQYDGKRLSEVARDMRLSAFDAVCELAIAEEAEVTIIPFEMRVEDVELAIAHPLCSVCSDGSGLAESAPGSPHPRNFAAFAHFLKHYLLDRKLVSVEEGVRRMTSWPAGRVGLKNRGLVVQGYYADLLVIDPRKLSTPADFSKPKQFSTGFKAVFVNGGLAVENDALTPNRHGRILRF